MEKNERKEIEEEVIMSRDMYFRTLKYYQHAMGNDWIHGAMRLKWKMNAYGENEWILDIAKQGHTKWEKPVLIWG